METKRFIYALCCPFTEDVHYIGKTTQGMLRPLQHTSNTHSIKVKEWVEELKEIGHKPMIKILENVSKDDDLDARERYWIQYHLNNGDLLLNDCLVTPLLISKDLDEIIGSSKGKEMERIGKFVKERRKLIGVRQVEFADKAGISLKVLRKIEQGKSNLQLDGLFTVLKMFGCTLDVVKIDK